MATDMAPPPMTHAATMPLQHQGGNGSDGVSAPSLPSPGITIELFQGQAATTATTTATAGGGAAAAAAGGGAAGNDDFTRPPLAHAR